MFYLVKEHDLYGYQEHGTSKTAGKIPLTASIVTYSTEDKLSLTAKVQKSQHDQQIAN